MSARASRQSRAFTLGGSDTRHVALALTLENKLRRKANEENAFGASGWLSGGEAGGRWLAGAKQSLRDVTQVTARTPVAAHRGQHGPH